MHFSVIFFENTIMRKHLKKKIDSDVVFTEKRLRHMCLTVIFTKFCRIFSRKFLPPNYSLKNFPPREYYNTNVKNIFV